MGNYRYTREERMIAITLRHAGYGYENIAKKLPGRSAAGISNMFARFKATRDALRKPEPDNSKKYVQKKRTCLRCLRTFKSEWSGHRLCRTCKQSGLEQYDHPMHP